jgi:hypothetical protein
MAETTSKTTTKKTAAKATPAKTTAVKSAAAPAAAKPAAKKPATKSAAGKKVAVTPEQHYCMVAEAAYFRAERNGFMSDPVRDWIEAEIEISAMLNAKKK